MKPSPSFFETASMDALKTLHGSVQKCYAASKDKICASPIPSVVGATIFGYLLRFLPLRIICSGLLRLMIIFTKSFLFMLGISKIYRLLQENWFSPQNPLASTDIEPLQDSPAGPS